jgi:hypothetical protein
MGKCVRKQGFICSSGSPMFYTFFLLTHFIYGRCEDGQQGEAVGYALCDAEDPEGGRADQ